MLIYPNHLKWTAPINNNMQDCFTMWYLKKEATLSYPKNIERKKRRPIKDNNMQDCIYPNPTFYISGERNWWMNN